MCSLFSIQCRSLTTNTKYLVVVAIIIDITLNSWRTCRTLLRPPCHKGCIPSFINPAANMRHTFHQLVYCDGYIGTSVNRDKPVGCIAWAHLPNDL